MMQAATHGRIGQDPREIKTRTGTQMVVASLAVSIDERDDAPLWLSLVAFGDHAGRLLRHQKGDIISASGKVQRSTWTTSAGEKREQLQLVVESLVSSRTVRPSGGKRKSKEEHGSPRPADDGRPFDDSLPF